MTIASNLYAEKVFSEQPLALWALDDTANFVSLIPENGNLSSSWATTNIESISIVESLSASYPIPSSYAISLVATEPTGETETASIAYPNAANFKDLDLNMGTISVSTYISPGAMIVSSVSLGYTYVNPLTSETEVVASSYSYDTSVASEWGFVSATLPFLDIDANFNIFLAVTYLTGTSSYSFEINGLTAGQWSENFSTKSSGIYLQEISTSIATEETLGVRAFAYGLQDNFGYYIGNKKVLYARNSGVPLVYGAESSTKIYPKNGPSLILPGFGVMNESGKFRDSTIEFWLRADRKTSEPRRIFGPIGKIGEEISKDGLYINGSFLTIKFGKHTASHFVNEWGRPMLINMRFSDKFVDVILNGEEVLSISVDVSTVQLPEKFITNGEIVLDQDWLGFYGYSDISEYEIDAVGIYPYRVPAIVSKRRFVYGQGVDFPENLNTAYNGSSIFIDYSFADYTNNYNYPDMGRWDQGATDNVATTGSVLSSPSFGLPNVLFADTSKTYESWLAANNQENIDNPEPRSFVMIRPSSQQGWESEEGYIFFDRLNFIGEDISSFYGVFQPTENSEEEQSLIRIENNLTSNYFLVSITGNTIAYKLKYGSTEAQTLYSLSTVVPDIAFAVGININRLASTFGGNVATFFGNKDQLKVYIGGSTSLTDTFTGKIFNIGFSTARNARKIDSFFNESGIASIPTDVSDVFMLYFDGSEDGQIDFTSVGGYVDPISGDWIAFEGTLDGGFADSFVFGRFQDHTASYTLIPKNFIGELQLDIAADSYWEDYVPLTYFASYITNVDGSREYDVDFLQFNISNTRPLASDDGAIDTSDSNIRTYITFQYLATGSNALDAAFVNRESVSPSHSVTPGTSWTNTKYEVVSGDVIYMPPGADINDLSIGIHVEIENPGVINNPIRITSLQFASQALNYATPNPVGTRFGYDIFPYSRSGIYFNYKGKNPYSIYKGSNPYLYMSKYSGIKLCGTETNRGISIRINEGLADEYAVGAIQMAVQYQEGLFPTTPVEVFEVQSSNLYAKFYMVAANPARTRARIYGVNVSSGAPISGLAFYHNGILVKDLFIEQDSWSIIGIQFAGALVYTSEAGAIRLTGPLLFNNISYYQLPSTQTSLTIEFRRWNQLSDLGEMWEDLIVPTQLLWQDVLYVSIETSFVVDPATIYREYVGTNRITATSQKDLRFGSYKYSVYADAEWRSSVLLPV
jgi:hypothetical protein